MIETGNGAEAARRAGYSERSARSITHENLTKPDVLAEIERRRTVVAREHEVTVEKLIADLREARELAIKLGRPSAAVGATMAMAKLCGLSGTTPESGADGAVATEVDLDVSDQFLDRMQFYVDRMRRLTPEQRARIRAIGR
ncbi:MAG: terminase small subunit [Alphaproteobacteria bacterium]